MPFEPRQATMPDIRELHAFLLGDAANNRLLPRSLSDLYARTRDFHLLYDEKGLLAGCCALSLVWEDLAEIRSLLVREDLRGKGLGRALVLACADAARALGIRRLFTLTYEKLFFNRLGFVEVGKDVLPQKIWADCIHCPKFPDCDEIAMQRDLEDKKP
ncbi:N-acetyltransferase [Desulfovibrio sp. OttesenSCG-928-G11]|nr:N-acetyltransferase [Desulfovibrio sp. OttesenSCG-928-G11]